jgi:hypothetical protein
MPNRLYQLCDGISFRAGRLPDGTQVLISRLGSDAMAIRFSTDGEFLKYDLYPVAADVDTPDSGIDAVVEYLGVRLETIHMRAFALPEYGIEIRDMPDYLQEYIDTPDRFPDERARHLKSAVEKWRRSGGFVLVWCEDYEISADGEFEST